MKNLRARRSRSILLATIGSIGFSPLGMAIAQETAKLKAGVAETVSVPEGEKSATNLDAVVVSAQRREEVLQDVPISILHFDATALENANATDLSDLGALSSGVRFDRRTNFVVPTIRGVTTNVVLAGSGTNVGVYTDGFYSPATQAADFQLLNIESVQILKGPQGTLFGRNTTAGAILVNTTQPSFTPQATFEAALGSYNSQRYQVYGTTGLGDNVAVDVAGMLSKGDGWHTNVANGDDKAGKYENRSFRIGLMADITDNLSVTGRYISSSTDDPSNLFHVPYILDGRPAAQAAYLPGAILPNGPSEISEDGELKYKFETHAYQLTAQWDLGWANLTSYTQYREDRQLKHKYTLDYVNLPVMGLDIHDYNDTFTQEFLLTSTGAGKLQYTAGVFYFDADQSFPYVGLSLGGGPWAFSSASGVNNRALAGFGDVTYELSERWFVSAGLRYSQDTVRDAFYTLGANTTTLPTLKDSRFTPRAVARYVVSPTTNVYMSYAKGYKAALYNVGGFVNDPVLAEELDSFEVGLKYSRRDLSFNVAAYHYDYGNQQVVSAVVVNGVPASRVTNAASSTMYGVEGDVQYRITPSFSVAAGASWSHARYGEFAAAPYFNWTPQNTFPQGARDASGNSMPRAPDWTANLSASYETKLAEGSLVISGNAYYSSAFYFEAANQLRQDSYTTLGLRLAWTDPGNRYTFAVSGRNITDTEYRSQGVLNAMGVAAIWSPPAMYEASVRVRF